MHPIYGALIRLKLKSLFGGIGWPGESTTAHSGVSQAGGDGGLPDRAREGWWRWRWRAPAHLLRHNRLRGGRRAQPLAYHGHAQAVQLPGARYCCRLCSLVSKKCFHWWYELLFLVKCSCGWVNLWWKSAKETWWRWRIPLTLPLRPFVSIHRIKVSLRY